MELLHNPKHEGVFPWPRVEVLQKSMFRVGSNPGFPVSQTMYIINFQATVDCIVKNMSSIGDRVQVFGLIKFLLLCYYASKDGLRGPIEIRKLNSIMNRDEGQYQLKPSIWRSGNSYMETSSDMNNRRSSLAQ